MKTTLETTFEDGDREAFVLALNDVAEAQATVRTAANGVSGVHEGRQTEAKQIHRLSVETLLLVLDTVGLKMEFRSV